jgi:hypothetical protein
VTIVPKSDEALVMSGIRELHLAVKRIRPSKVNRAKQAIRVFITIATVIVFDPLTAAAEVDDFKISANETNSARNLKLAFTSLSEDQRINIQSNLESYGYYSGALDGLWGKQTEAAILSSLDGRYFPSADASNQLEAQQFVISLLGMVNEGNDCEDCSGAIVNLESGASNSEKVRVPVSQVELEALSKIYEYANVGSLNSIALESEATIKFQTDSRGNVIFDSISSVETRRNDSYSSDMFEVFRRALARTRGFDNEVTFNQEYEIEVSPGPDQIFVYKTVEEIENQKKNEASQILTEERLQLEGRQRIEALLVEEKQIPESERIGFRDFRIGMPLEIVEYFSLGNVQYENSLIEFPSSLCEQGEVSIYPFGIFRKCYGLDYWFSFSTSESDGLEVLTVFVGDYVSSGSTAWDFVNQVRGEDAFIDLYQSLEKKYPLSYLFKERERLLFNDGKLSTLSVIFLEGQVTLSISRIGDLYGGELKMFITYRSPKIAGAFLADSMPKQAVEDF